MIALLAGCALGAGSAGTMFMLLRRQHFDGYCPRCAGYLRWRENFFRGLGKKPAPLDRGVW